MRWGQQRRRTAATRAIETQAQQRAESVGLTLSDFPAGWRASVPDEEASGESFRECLGTDYSDLTYIGEARSKDFAQGSAEVFSEVIVAESEAQAEEAVNKHAAGMGRATAADCVRDLLEEGLAEQDDDEDVELGEVDVGELSLDPQDVEQTAAWQIAITVEVTSGAAEGISPTVYLDIVAMRRGDTLAYLRTEDVLTPFDAALRDELLKAMADRMAESFVR